MLLQCVLQTAFVRVFLVRRIIVRTYFHAYNRISFGKGFTVLQFLHFITTSNSSWEDLGPQSVVRESGAYLCFSDHVAIKGGEGSVQLRCSRKLSTFYAVYYRKKDIRDTNLFYSLWSDYALHILRSPEQYHVAIYICWPHTHN
jgi:hypothetical protein